MDATPERPADDRPIVIVSNRGPISFKRNDDGTLQARRGAGGLVSGLGPLVAGTDTIWIAAAMSDADREAGTGGVIEADGFHVRLLSIDPAVYRQSYDVVCNSTLWFTHHGLFDLSRRPRIDRHWHQAWEAYRAVNEAFADAVAAVAPEGAVVLVQDYHLCLVGSILRERRPDLSTVHFSHTPFATARSLRTLPSAVRAELLAGMAAHDACGFHAPRWADAFAECCADNGIAAPRTFVSPLGPDPQDLAAVATSDACAEALAALDVAVGDRAFVVRVDRIELSKNLLRGFWVFDDLLTHRPQWRGRVVFGAFVYPSREGLPEYLAYRQEVEGVVRQLNEKWATPDWTPILFDPSDHFPRSVAALRRYDVLLVNPISDGLNLVAKEGPTVNERNGIVALSTEAGAFAELAGAVLTVDPYDISGTADVLDSALVMADAERADLAAEVKRRALARGPADWLADQLAIAQR